MAHIREILEPCEAESIRWLRDIGEEMMQYEVAAWCGCSEAVIGRWRSGTASPPMVYRRLLWLLWCLLYDNSRLATLGDMMTWGRFTHSARLETGWHRGRRRGKPAKGWQHRPGGSPNDKPLVVSSVTKRGKKTVLKNDQTTQGSKPLDSIG